MVKNKFAATDRYIFNGNRCNDGEGNTLEDSGPLKKHGSLHGAKFLSSSLELGKQE